MPRSLSSTYLVNGFPWWGTRADTLMLDQSTASSNHPIYFVKLEFDSADVNLHSGHGDIIFNGDTYTGAGAIGAISGIEETVELGRSPVTLTMGGLPTTLIAALLNEQSQGRKATIYLGYMNMTTYKLVENPVIIHRGLMDTPDFNQDKELSISLKVESRFAQWDNPKVRRFTNEDQKSRYPTDTGFQFVETSVEKAIYWGQKSL